jgi:hypothetical protein
MVSLSANAASTSAWIQSASVAINTFGTVGEATSRERSHASDRHSGRAAGLPSTPR